MAIVHLYRVYGCCGALATKLSSCKRDHMTYKT